MRSFSTFIHGYDSLPMRLTERLAPEPAEEVRRPVGSPAILTLWTCR